MSFTILSAKAPIIWALYTFKSCSCLVPRSQNSSGLRLNYRQGDRRNRIRLQAGPAVANPNPRVRFSGKVQNAAFYHSAISEIRNWIRHWKAKFSYSAQPPGQLWSYTAHYQFTVSFDLSDQDVQLTTYRHLMSRIGMNTSNLPYEFKRGYWSEYRDKFTLNLVWNVFSSSPSTVNDLHFFHISFPHVLIKIAASFRWAQAVLRRQD